MGLEGMEGRLTIFLLITHTSWTPFVLQQMQNLVPLSPRGSSNTCPLGLRMPSARSDFGVVVTCCDDWETMEFRITPPS